MKNQQLGFTSLEREIAIEQLPIEGEIPHWLSGTLIRNGPAKFEVGRQSYNHWFDGLAMLHKFSFTKGRVSYANRFIRSEAYKKAEETGKISYREFATDPCRSIFKKVSSIFSPKFTDNTNVNVTRIANKFVAMTETPLPIEFDPNTLNNIGVLNYGNHDVTGNLTTAHPHYDHSKREMINYITHFSRVTTYNIYRIRSGTNRELIRSLEVNEPSYMHSFGLTEHYVILAEFPFVVKPLSMLTSGKPFIENYSWKPENGTRFFIIDRQTGNLVNTCKSKIPFFAFHHVNAFETSDGIYLDIVAYDDASVIQRFYLPALREGNDYPISELRRYNLSLQDSSVTHEILSTESLELPRINYKKNNMKNYEFLYAVAGQGGYFANKLVKINLNDKSSTIWSDENCYPGEPVFVAKQNGVGEDEGVVLSVVLDGNNGNSLLLVLDAITFEEIARAQVPHHIPFGFHGQYFNNIENI